VGDTGFIHALSQKRNENSEQWFVRIDAYFKVVPIKVLNEWHVNVNLEKEKKITMA